MGLSLVVRLLWVWMFEFELCLWWVMVLKRVSSKVLLYSMPSVLDRHGSEMPRTYRQGRSLVPHSARLSLLKADGSSRL